MSFFDISNAGESLNAKPTGYRKEEKENNYMIIEENNREKNSKYSRNEELEQLKGF